MQLRVTCGECRHYLPDEMLPGTCKRYPPTVLANGSQVLPRMHPADGCGEASREEPTA